MPAQLVVPLDVRIGPASPDSQMGEIWLLAIEALIGSAGAARGGHAVPDMDKGGEGFTPEGMGETRLCQSRCDALQNGPVGALCNSILLGMVPCAVAPLNAMLSTESVPRLAHVLPTLVILYGTDSRPV